MAQQTTAGKHREWTDKTGTRHVDDPASMDVELVARLFAIATKPRTGERAGPRVEARP